MSAAQRPIVLIIGDAMVSVVETSGWQVVATDMKADPNGRHLTLDIGVCTDPGHADHRQAIATLRATTGGRFKALIANAAHQMVKPSTEFIAASRQQTLGVNLFAPFWLAIAFKGELAANRGSFLAIASIHER